MEAWAIVGLCFLALLMFFCLAVIIWQIKSLVTFDEFEPV